MAEDGDASHPNPLPGSSDGSDFAPSTSKHNANEDQSNLVPPYDDGERKEKALIEANEMMSSGLDAVNKRDFTRAVGCYSRALQIGATHLGEHAIESAKAYHEYGRALLDKVLQEADPTSSLARKEREFREFYFPATTESSDASGDAEGTDRESEGKSDSEGLFGAEKDQSDLDLANKILAKARDIAHKYLEKKVNTATVPMDVKLELYDIFSAYVKVALAREDFESSIRGHHDTLLTMAYMLKRDSTRIISLNSRLCIYLASARPSDAIKYCEMAIIVSKSRIKLIKANAEVLKLTSPDPVKEAESTREIQRLTNLVGKLEHKLHDLEKIVRKRYAVPGGNIKPPTVLISDTSGSTEAPSTSGTGGNTETASTSGTGGTLETASTSGTAGGTPETASTSGTAGGTPETASISGTCGSPETASTSGTAGGTPETASPSGTGGLPETASPSVTVGSNETASTSGTGGSTETSSTSDTGYAGRESDQGSEGRGVKRDPTGPPVDPSPTKKPAFDLK